MTATLQQEKKDTPDKLITNCPFYGTAYYEGSPRGTPQMDGLPVDWRACRIVRHMRMERDDE